MARIVLGIGTSHTPMLNVGVEDWRRFEDLDRRRSHLHKDGRPATYGELLAIAPPSLQAELAPEKLAERHAEAMTALGRLHQTLAAARLDVAVIVGDDQKEIYHDDHMPSILVYRGETIANVPNRTRATEPDVAWRPDWAKRASARYYEESETRHYPVDSKLANHLIAALVDREFDVSTANALPAGEGEGHAFGFVHQRLMKGLAIPVVPVFLNTYYPPNQPSPRRCYRLGQAIRQAIEGYPEDLRIGVVASGGLSHFTIDEALDGEVIRALREKDADALQSLPREQLNSGSSEIRNWICAAGALEHLDLQWLHYAPGYRTPAGTGTGLCFAHWA
ncbi:extradiol ring-cleavage dioxygenase [Reyranella sp.]|uniref:DODA-type extradiol aromatic ring-opening family dioxygenase n=1 Tax=Reyranella sp. TaxID=1929291 RepID=UPI003D14393C